MSFTMYGFILLFLPVTVINYFAIPAKQDKARKVFLIAVSFFFYSFANAKLALFLAALGLINFALAKIIKHRKRVFLWLPVGMNIALLVYTKYMNFFISSWNALFHQNMNLITVFAPLALSFLTFQMISYQVDSFLYFSYYPKIIQGPITFYNDLIDQF